MTATPDRAEPVGVVDTTSAHRVLVSVSPPLLGELVARELRRGDLEVVVVDDPRGFRDEREFALVVTNGLPPAGVRIGGVVRLPDRARDANVGSLVTTAGVQRLPIPELAALVHIVQELCGGTRSEPG